MTDKAFPRQDFDGALVYVVQRAITMNGETLVPGQVFDKALVSNRKLRQLYDQRYLRLAEVGDSQPPPTRAVQPRAAKNARLSLR